MKPPLDTLTVALSWHGRPQTKRIGRDRDGRLTKRGFANEKLYRFQELPVLGIEDLAATLERLSRNPAVGAVRGTPIPGSPAPCRRLARPDPATGDPATLAETPRRVTAFDIDGIDQGVAEDPAFAPEDGVERVIGLLADTADPSFADGSFWWQYSSSQGLEPGKLHLRLWSIASHPVADEDMRRWAREVNRRAGLKLVDPALYNPAQPHYLAAPVLDGIPDPLPRRSGFRRGLSDTIEIVVPEPAPAAPSGGDGLGLKPAHGFENYLAAIGGEHGFNNAIYRAICSYVGTHGGEGTDPVALRERLREAVLAADPGHRSRADISRYASDRYLDDEIARVLARKGEEQRHGREQAEGLQGRRADSAAGPAPHFPAGELDPAEAAAALRDTLAEVVRQALEWTGATPAPQVGVKAAAGLGKSTATLEELARAATLPHGVDFNETQQPETWWFSPTAALGEELAAKARALGLAAQVVRGREAVVGGEPLCKKHEAAAAIARAGLPVMKMLCKDEGPDGRPVTCPYFNGCRYLRQFRADGPAIRFFAHEYLPLVGHLPKAAPYFGLPPPAFVVIDESFALRLARHASLGIDRLTTPRAGMKVELEAEVHPVAVKVRDLLEGGGDPREAADAATFKRLAGLELFLGGEADIWPGMRWEEQRRRAALLRKTDRFKLAALWRTLAEEKAKPRPVQRVELRRNEPVPGGEVQDRVHVHWRAKLGLPDVPTLLLDGSLDERIAAKFFPRLEVRSVTARRNAEVVQVSDTACSRNRLLSFDSAPESEQQRAANRLEDVRHLAEVEAKRGRILLVTYRPAEERLGAIPGVDVAHFGALRGLDRFKDHDTIVVAGREQPPPAEVEALARALFGDEDEPLALPGTFAGEPRGVRLRDGTRRGWQVVTHPDPRCQAILEQIRERETEQAIDRLRLVHRERPARVILLSNVVVDVTVDRLATWNELVPDRLTAAAARLDGVLPLAPAWLAERFPDLWVTARAAETALQRAEKTTQTPNRESYLGFAYFSAAYRVEGQRGRPSRALIRADHPSPEAALADLVGPLALFRREGDPPPEGAAPAAEPPPPPKRQSLLVRLRRLRTRSPTGSPADRSRPCPRANEGSCSRDRLLRRACAPRFMSWWRRSPACAGSSGRPRQTLRPAGGSWSSWTPSRPRPSRTSC